MFFDMRFRRSQFIHVSEYRLGSVLMCKKSQKEKIIDAGKLFNLSVLGVIRINSWVLRLDKSNIEIRHNFLTLRGIEQRNIRL